MGKLGWGDKGLEMSREASGKPNRRRSADQAPMVKDRGKPAAIQGNRSDGKPWEGTQVTEERVFKASCFVSAGDLGEL